MARIKKKGTTGAAKNFITRSKAVSKLQISLADFRRLCIFKGIYPREPRNKKKANKGSTAPVTFYYAKDIQYLMHEPVLAKFREHKTFSKKLSRALNKNEIGDADRLEKNRPRYTLNHIVRERYPTFVDALRDLDDPLNMLFLFANMPATDSVGHRITNEAEKLTNHWLAYVARERLIKKVFVSIKGVYYLATVKGQEVRWLVPFKFPTNIPSDIDFRIMLTFLELYSTLLHFVLFKLYSDAGLVYPPPIDAEKLKSVGGLSSYVLTSKDNVGGLAQKPSSEENATEIGEGSALSNEEIKKAMDADALQENLNGGSEETDQEDVERVELDEFSASNKTTGDLLSQPSRFASPTSTLFSKFTFFVGREVSMDILELCILSAGGKVVSEILLDEMKLKQPELYKTLDLTSITHQIIDRPKVLNKVAGRTYIQPQWIFDSINKSELLPVGEYAPGETLPPHLSPWGDRGNYDAEGSTVAREGEQEEEEESEVEDGEVEDEDAEEIDEEDAQAIKEQKELEMEAAGVKYSDIQAEESESKKSKKSKKSAEDEEKELRKIMMSNKNKKLYNSMQAAAQKKEDRVKQLTKKRKQIEKVKKELNKVTK